MLESKQSGSAVTNPNFQILLAFKPRQVLLAEQNSKLTTMKQCNSSSSSSSRKTLTLNPDQKALLLQSVILYLERNGFSKTLKRLVSEAQIETDNWKTCSLNLEDMYGNYLETCTHAETKSDTYKEQELLTDGVSKKSGDCHGSGIEQTVGKKKKSGEDDKNAAENLSETSDIIAESTKNSREILVKDSLTDSNVELKEKKKSKKVSEQVSTQALKDSKPDTVSELQIDESTKKQKDKKKKKSKSISESLDGYVEQVQLDTLPVLKEEKCDNSKPSLADGKIDSESEVKSKDKKKKNKPSTDSLGVNSGNIEQGLSNSLPVATEDKSEDNNNFDSKAEGKSKDKKKKKKKESTDTIVEEVEQCEALENMRDVPLEEKKVDKEKKGSKKRKRLASEENEVQPVEKVAIEEPKRRKTETLEETKSCEQLTEVNANTGDDDHAGKESRRENDPVGQNELQNTSKKKPQAPTNWNLEKDGEKSAQKTRRQQHEGSAEPKTVNAFQRVKIDEVTFADERLQDNSYWAKGGAEVGYGAKAQEILGQVRGRDFRHEKTKKKRGSYRGGQIDLQTHSIKFNYSDEE